MSVFFFDLDGTLWDENCRIPESTKKALGLLHKAGHMLFICTGRTKGFLNVPELAGIPFDGGIYGCGTQIEYENRELFCTTLDPEKTQRIVDCSRVYRLLPILEGPEYMYLDPALLEYAEMQKNTLQYRNPVRTVQSDTAAMTIQKATCIYTAASDAEQFNAELSTGFTVIARSGLSEIVPEQYSKASGIQYLLDFLHADKSCSYAFGDSENDLPMLAHAGHGIAMGNSPDSVKQAAEFVTDDIRDGGISSALKKLGFI